MADEDERLMPDDFEKLIFCRSDYIEKLVYRWCNLFEKLFLEGFLFSEGENLFVAHERNKFVNKIAVWYKKRRGIPANATALDLFGDYSASTS